MLHFYIVKNELYQLNKIKFDQEFEISRINAQNAENVLKINETNDIPFLKEKLERDKKYYKIEGNSCAWLN